MSYILAIGGGTRAGLDASTVAAFSPLDDAKRAAVSLAMQPGQRYQETNNYQRQQRGLGSESVYLGPGTFAYFSRSGGTFTPRSVEGDVLRSQGGGPVTLVVATLARSFVGGDVFVDLDGRNQWTPATVASDGTTVASVGGAPVPATTAAAEILDASDSALRSAGGGLRVLYTAGDGGLLLGANAPAAVTAPPTTVAALALTPRDGRRVAIAAGSGWRVVEWR